MYMSFPYPKDSAFLNVLDLLFNFIDLLYSKDYSKHLQFDIILVDNDYSRHLQFDMPFSCPKDSAFLF